MVVSLLRVLPCISCVNLCVMYDPSNENFACSKKVKRVIRDRAKLNFQNSQKDLEEVEA
jgi:hypothetical protein